MIRDIKSIAYVTYIISDILRIKQAFKKHFKKL